MGACASSMRNSDGTHRRRPAAPPAGLPMRTRIATLVSKPAATSAGVPAGGRAPGRMRHGRGCCLAPADRKVPGAVLLSRWKLGAFGSEGRTPDVDRHRVRRNTRERFAGTRTQHDAHVLTVRQGRAVKHPLLSATRRARPWNGDRIARDRWQHAIHEVGTSEVEPADLLPAASDGPRDLEREVHRNVPRVIRVEMSCIRFEHDRDPPPVAADRVSAYQPLAVVRPCLVQRLDELGAQYNVGHWLDAPRRPIMLLVAERHDRAGEPPRGGTTCLSDVRGFDRTGEPFSGVRLKDEVAVRREHRVFRWRRAREGRPHVRHRTVDLNVPHFAEHGAVGLVEQSRHGRVTHGASPQSRGRRRNLTGRAAAPRWVLANQLGRRNLTPESVAYLRGKLYREEKRQGERTDLTSAQSEQKSEGTDARLSDQFKASPATIRRDAKFSEQLDALAEEPTIPRVYASPVPKTRQFCVSHFLSQRSHAFTRNPRVGR